MYCLQHLLGAIAFTGCGVLFVSSAVTGCGADGARGSNGAVQGPYAGVDESTVDKEEVVEEATTNLVSVPDFAPTDLDAQVLAQAACTALKSEGGWSFAIRRDCNNFAADCNTLCSNITEEQAGRLRCINSLHVYPNQPHSAPATIGLKTYRYNNCGGGCGPNYCCCGN